MKRVILLGDSIRLGYEATVRAELADVAFVWSPGDNGQHSVNLLLNFWTWVVTQQPDVLHMNAGMWDTRRVVRHQVGNVVPVENYRVNVDRLISLAQQHTKAKIIWATTTPADQVRANLGHLHTGLAGRDASDIERYNEAAVAVARARGVAVDDLHRVVTEAGVDRVRSADGVHYTAEGFEILGRAVARAIRAAME